MSSKSFLIFLTLSISCPVLLFAKNATEPLTLEVVFHQHRRSFRVASPPKAIKARPGASSVHVVQEEDARLSASVELRWRYTGKGRRSPSVGPKQLLVTLSGTGESYVLKLRELGGDGGYKRPRSFRIGPGQYVTTYYHAFSSPAHTPDVMLTSRSLGAEVSCSLLAWIRGTLRAFPIKTPWTTVLTAR